MGCHAPLGEDVDDDDREFLAAAQEDATLVADLLIFLSRSGTYGPRRQQLPEPASPSTGTEDDAPPLPDPPKWGKRRARSRCLTMEGILAAKREEARRASPTTPLSWSGGSWTSGSVCKSTPPRPPKRRKQPDGQKAAAPCRDSPPPPAKAAKPEPYENRGEGVAPACKWMKVETVYKDGEPHRVLVAGEPAAVGSSSCGSGSCKAVTAAEVPGSLRTVAHTEPLRSRWTGEGTKSVVARRPGKKKTLPELKALKESLSQEQVQLLKELEEQNKIYEVLLEENNKLKSMESSVAFHAVGEPTVAPRVREGAESGEPQQPQTVEGQSTAVDRRPERPRCRSLPTSAPQRAPLFDLNCPPDDGLL